MAQNDWQPIETAPKDGGQVLVTNGVLVLAVRWWPGRGWGEAARLAPLVPDWDPTHWMPLPGATRERGGE